MGFTCPNIDGRVAKGGCTFCENESFSPNLTQKQSRRFTLHPDSAENPHLQSQILQLERQFHATRAKLSKKFGAKKFIVYFQSFTNTYAPFETLKTLYEYALSLDDVVGLSIGTRADSVTEELLKYLNGLAESSEIWIEYGIQSIFQETLDSINRGENVDEMLSWIRKTKSYPNLKVCGHLIYGLPEETEEMMLQTAKTVIGLKLDALKIHPMYVTKNTALAIDYQKGRFIPITQEIYTKMLIETFRILPEEIMIWRITAGINDASLLAPEWCRCKQIQMREIKRALREAGFIY